MKLRLRGNTVRLRLIQNEVKRLAQGETLRETLPTKTPFSFEVTPLPVDAVSVEFADGVLSVSVPAGWAAEWADNDVVGRQDRAGEVDVLIEKDWACTTPRSGEDNAGAYPNPTALR
jgi:hypothetical protein